MKSIAFVVDSFPNISETFIISQVVYLKRKGYDITIFSRYKVQTSRVHSLVYENDLFSNILYFEKAPKTFLLRIIKILKFLIKNFSFKILYDIIKCLNIFKIGMPAASLFVAYNYIFFRKLNSFDIIHAHFGWNGKIVSYYMSLNILKKKRFITTFHGADIDPSILSKLKVDYKLLFKYCDHLTVNSIYSFNLLKNIKGISKNIKLLPVGLDTAIFTPCSDEKEKSDIIKLIFVGRLIKLKGVLLIPKIIDQVLKLSNIKIHCLIVGSGVQENNLLQEINLLGLSDICELVGESTQDQVLKHMRESDIFIFPAIKDPISNRVETQGLVVQEAQSVGLPVLVSDAGGIKYGILDGITGYVIKEGDIDSYVDKILLLISNPELRKSLGREGRKFVVENFDYRYLGIQLEMLYSN